MQNAKCKVQSASAKCKVQSAKCKVQSAWSRKEFRSSEPSYFALRTSHFATSHFAFRALRTSHFALRTSHFALCIALCIAAVAGCKPAPAATAASGVSDWVAFEGEFRSIAGGTETRGRVYRRRDGSFRKETHDVVGVPAFITIENRVKKAFYSYSGGSWTAQPWRRTPPGPPAASRFPNATPQAERVAGLRVVRWDTGWGVMTLRAPELDYYPLLEEHPFPPLRIQYVAVTRKDPPDPLFEPPPGSQVDDLPWEYTGATPLSQ